MVKYSNILLAPLVAAVILVSGCSQYVKVYEGPTKPDQEISKVKFKSPPGYSWKYFATQRAGMVITRVLGIDPVNVSFAEGARIGEINLIPGKYTIYLVAIGDYESQLTPSEMRWSQTTIDRSCMNSRDYDVQLDTKPGTVYYIWASNGAGSPTMNGFKAPIDQPGEFMQLVVDEWQSITVGSTNKRCRNTSPFHALISDSIGF